MKNKTFIVLGMHRSATSLLARGLHMSDIVMGERLLGKSESNKYGHWEDVDFVELNESILHSAGGTWDNPPSWLPCIYDLWEAVTLSP